MKLKTCTICGGKLEILVKNHFDDRHGFVGKFDVLRCQSCGCATSSPRLSKIRMNRIYQRHYPTSKLDISKVQISDYFRPSDEEISDLGTWINSHYFAKKGDVVLDVGCGLGFSLLELLNHGCRPHGIDPNLQAARLAKRFEIPFHLGYLEDKPFGSKKFDLICASQVLEHTGDPVKFLIDCKKRINGNGRIILSFPNIDAWYRKILGNRWLHWHLPYHYDFLSKKGIYLIAKESGLKVTNIQTMTPNMWSTLQLRHLMTKQIEGKRDELWDGKVSGGKKGMNILGTIYQALLKSNFINRIIDYLDGGESWVVIFKVDSFSIHHN